MHEDTEDAAGNLLEVFKEDQCKKEGDQSETPEFPGLVPETPNPEAVNTRERLFSLTPAEKSIWFLCTTVSRRNRTYGYISHRWMDFTPCAQWISY